MFDTEESLDGFFTDEPETPGRNRPTNKMTNTHPCCPYCLNSVFQSEDEVMDYCLECDIKLEKVMHVHIDNGEMILPEKTGQLTLD